MNLGCLARPLGGVQRSMGKANPTRLMQADGAGDNQHRNPTLGSLAGPVRDGGLCVTTMYWVTKTENGKQTHLGGLAGPVGGGGLRKIRNTPRPWA